MDLLLFDVIILDFLDSVNCLQYSLNILLFELLLNCKYNKSIVFMWLYIKNYEKNVWTKNFQGFKKTKSFFSNTLCFKLKKMIIKCLSNIIEVLMILMVSLFLMNMCKFKFSKTWKKRINYFFRENNWLDLSKIINLKWF